MKIKEDVSEPVRIILNDIPQTVRQHLASYEIKTPEDMTELQTEMLKGRDVVMIVDKLVMIRWFEPTKVQLSGAPQ